MDQLPKLPMLYFDLKQSPNSVDFNTSFQKRILEIYSQDAANFINEIQEFEVLRSNAVRVTHDVNGCMLLKRYYAQLSIVNNKFHYTSRSCDLKFTWIDTFTKSNVTGDIQLELDSILFNIGALHSELGAGGQRSTSESIKVACTHFQCAAWVFKKLKENTHFKSKDLSQDLMAFNYYIMLAQAQECFLDKAILDKRNSSITAKIAAEVVAYYDYLIVILLQAETQEKDNLFNKLFKEWKKFFVVKISFYSAICSYFMGKYEEIKMGERVAWLKDADEKLKELIKLARSLGKPNVIESVDYFAEIAKKSLEQAIQNNDFIYHEIVPTLDKLAAIKGVSLVKEIGFSVSDAEVMGKDIFGKLVPIEAYQTVSIYSDRRDQKWREIKSKIDDKNEELVKFLSVIQLDKDNVRERKFNVPEKLASICASLNDSSTNFLDDVRERLNKLDELGKEVDEKFKVLEKTIEDEEEAEKSSNYQLKSSISSLRAEFDRNYGVHKSAMESNEGLHDVIKTHQKDIELLMNSSVQDLERLFSMSAEDLPMSKDNLAELEKLFDKIEEMKKQRAFLENKLKQSIKNDDILKSVVAHSESEIESVFEKENEKFGVDLKYLEQNMSAQANILNALTKANADYADTRKAFIKLEKLRNEKIESFYESYENFQGVLINLDKGIEFYANLKQVIQQLNAKIVKHIEERKLNQSKSGANSSIGDTNVSSSTNAATSPSANTISSLNCNRNDSTITNNIPFNENKGQSKLKDFLPYYDPTKSQNLSNLTRIPATNLASNVIPNQQPVSNVPTIVPNRPVSNLSNLSQVSNLSNLPQVSNYSNLSTHIPQVTGSLLPNQSMLQQAKPTINPNFQTTTQVSNPYLNYYPTVNQPATYPSTNTNYTNPYANYAHPNMLPSTVYQQHVPSTQLNYSTSQQPTTVYQNGQNYYMPTQQYLPPSTSNYYSSTEPANVHHPQTILNQMPSNIQSNPANLAYGMQHMNLNNGNYANSAYQNYNYVQSTVVQQPVNPLVHQPKLPSAPPVDILNSDNNLSEDVQPVLIPTSLVNTDQSSTENVKK